MKDLTAAGQTQQSSIELFQAKVRDEFRSRTMASHAVFDAVGSSVLLMMSVHHAICA
jgi:hypothetical protein